MRKRYVREVHGIALNLVLHRSIGLDEAAALHFQNSRHLKLCSARWRIVREPETAASGLDVGRWVAPPQEVTGRWLPGHLAWPDS
jgi:hypothetical protein